MARRPRRPWVNLYVLVDTEDCVPLRQFILLILSPVLVNAGVVYDMAIRPVDQSAIGLVSPTAPSSVPVVTHFFVEDGKVRIGNPGAKNIYLFDDRTMYVIDTTARSVHVLKHATLKQLAAHYAEAVKQLETAAADASAAERAEAERKAGDMKEVSDRMRQSVPRDFKVTVRFESVDGHACRIWEEREKDLKRLELCVAAPATVPGAADILSGLRTLSQFRQGSNFAFGIEFGLSDWWPDFASLGGVPILIREYKYDSEIAEVVLSNMEPLKPGGALFDLPAGYGVVEGPDFTQWYVH